MGLIETAKRLFGRRGESLEKYRCGDCHANFTATRDRVDVLCPYCDSRDVTPHR